jgi:Phosphatidylserine/phosphatidylglycerophosphate/cardiolipin synthases and related enzymes
MTSHVKNSSLSEMFRLFFFAIYTLTLFKHFTNKTQTTGWHNRFITSERNRENMKKIRQVITSRFFIAGFFIFAEFAQLLTVFILLNRFSTIMSVLSYIFTFCVILYVINRDEIPELKLPWLILFLVLPVISAFIFILFSGTEQTKKLTKAYGEADKELSRFQANDTQKNLATKSLKEKNLDAYMQANYIHRVTGMSCHDSSKSTYYPVGEDFHKALLEALQKAEHFIFMEYFIIEQGAMWNYIHDILLQKVRQGVKVNVMYDDFGCMPTLPQHYYRELTNEGIDCIPFNRVTPILSQIHNNRDHRKITVIDGVVGFTGGANLADEYINLHSKHGHWKDSAVKIEGEAVKNLTMMFLSSWNMQSNTQLLYEPYLDISYPAFKNGGMIIPYGDVPGLFKTESLGRGVYLNMINAAKKYLYITTPYLICDFAIIDALRNSAKKGVDVRIITPGIPDKKLVWLLTRSSYKSLLLDGVKIYEYTPGFIHAKNFICDDMFAVCGTINLDYRSLVHHFECGAWMYNVDAIQDMKTDFIETIGQSEMITDGKVKFNGFQKLLINILKVLFPLL